MSESPVNPHFCELGVAGAATRFTALLAGRAKVGSAHSASKIRNCGRRGRRSAGNAPCGYRRIFGILFSSFLFSMLLRPQAVRFESRVVGEGSYSFAQCTIATAHETIGEPSSSIPAKSLFFRTKHKLKQETNVLLGSIQAESLQGVHNELSFPGD